MDLISGIKGAFAQAGDNAAAAAQETLSAAARGAFTQAQAAVPIPTGSPPLVATTANTQPGAAVNPSLTVPAGMSAMPRWAKIAGAVGAVAALVWFFRPKRK